LVLPIIAYTLSSTKIEIRARKFLPGSKGVERERKGVGGKGEEMIQTLYAHINKRKKKKLYKKRLPLF
jgi:hypothetical protein